MASAYKKSKSGNYSVTLKKGWRDRGFLYKPSHTAITVNEATLEAMLAEDVIDTVAPAE